MIYLVHNSSRMCFEVRSKRARERLYDTSSVYATYTQGQNKPKAGRPDLRIKALRSQELSIAGRGRSDLKTENLPTHLYYSK